MAYSFLIQPKRLWEELQTGCCIVLDCSWYLPNKDQATKSGLEEFLRARIPNSIFFDIDLVASNGELPHMLPDEETFSRFMQWFRIGKQDKLVLYDYCGTWSSFRAYWMFQIFDYNNVYILDGGFARWQADCFPIETEKVNNPHRFTHTIPPFAKAGFQGQHRLLSSLAEVEHQLAHQRCHLIDLRSAERFNGVPNSEPRYGMPSGCIPGSINIPYTRFVDEKRQHLLDVDGIDKLLQDTLGPDWQSDTNNLVFMCGTGVASCVAFAAVADLLKSSLEDDRLISVYDGSWYEYVYRRIRPAESNKAG